MAAEKRVIATIYGPVGQVIREEGKSLRLDLQSPLDTPLSSACAKINVAIDQGEAFIGPDRVARAISENPSPVELDTLQLVLDQLSSGDLRLVPTDTLTVTR